MQQTGFGNSLQPIKTDVFKSDTYSGKHQKSTILWLLGYNFNCESRMLIAHTPL